MLLLLVFVSFFLYDTYTRKLELQSYIDSVMTHPVDSDTVQTINFLYAANANNVSQTSVNNVKQSSVKHKKTNKKKTYSKKKKVKTQSYATSTRCLARTKAGNQCKRKAQSGRNYCWQH